MKTALIIGIAVVVVAAIGLAIFAWRGVTRMALEVEGDGV